LLDVKAERARRLLRPCTLCALNCRVDRLAGPAGACGLGAGLRPYLDFIHEGEEPEISPTHAILLAGCNYRCGYCSDWAHVAEPLRAAEVEPAELARAIDARRRAGAASLSWIGGEPGVNLPAILEVLARATVSTPVVWNSNMHSTAEVQDLLEGIVDAYVADWKHGSEACAREVARVPDYLAVVPPAIARAAREAFTIVRHLVIPGHVECCTLPSLERIARELPGVRVNLMAQFRPNANVAGSALDRRPGSEELERARARARELGLDLAARGKLVGPAASAALERAASERAFESSIFVDDDGHVTIENLSPELREIAGELGFLEPAPEEPSS
jgi:putative pyruvate formate lyase activating enzyme